MAEIDSSDEDGIVHLWCTSESQSLRRTKRQLFLQDDWDRSWREIASGETRGASREDKYEHRLPIKSSKSDIPRTSSAISSTHSLPNSDMMHILSKEREYKPSIETGSLSSIIGPQRLLDNFEDNNGEGRLPLNTQPKRSSSPRRQISSYQTEARNMLPTLPVQTGPLERFLAQDDSHTAHPNPEHQKEEWTRLRFLRANSLRLRALLRTKRKELQEKQSAKISADEAFIKHVREHHSAANSTVVSIGTDILDKLYEAMQDSRDEYGPLQDEYDATEELLDETEFEMGMIEGRIHRSAVQMTPESAKLQPRVDERGDFSSLAPSSVGEFSSVYKEEYDPLHAQYLSRLGDLDLARERYHSMMQEYSGLLSTQESRSKVGLELHENLQSILAELPERKLTLEENIAEIRKDVERLRLECLAAGIDIDESRSDRESLNEDSNTDNEYNIANEVEVILEGGASPPTVSTQSVQSMFPLLFPQTEQTRASFEELAPKFDVSNKSDLINGWLFVELQTNRLQVALLLRVALQVFLHWKIDLDNQQWQIDVLYFWARDDANKAREEFTSQAHSSTVQSHPSVSLRGRPHAKSTASRTKFLDIHPNLRNRRSAPGSLEILNVVKGFELLENVRS